MSWSAKIARDGFAVIPEVFDAATIDNLSREIDRTAPLRSKAGIRHALKIPPVDRFAHLPTLVEIAQDVLGPNAFPFRATFFNKSAQSNWLVAWHQDRALPLQKRQDVSDWGPWSVKDGIHYAHAPASALRQVLALRIHLDDSTELNGPLRVLPGTHLGGVLNNDAIHNLATQHAPIECFAPKGGVVAMRPLILHASSKSRSRATRRVLHIEYAAGASVGESLDLAIA